MDVSATGAAMIAQTAPKASAPAAEAPKAAPAGATDTVSISPQAMAKLQASKDCSSC